MGRFSLEMEFLDEDGPSSPTPKRARFRYKTPATIILDKIEEEEEEESSQSQEDEEIDVSEESVSEKIEIDEEEEEENDVVSTSKVDGSITVTLTDPDVLDCPICLEPLSIPVFQCENGHIACSCCCGKLKNKCPSCTFPIGYNRCRAIEKVLESIKVPCRNTKFGCSSTSIYSKLSEHEKRCPFLPVTCPIPDCHFTAGPTLTNDHVRVHHSELVTEFRFNKLQTIFLYTDTNYVILREKKTGQVFVLNHAVVDRVGSLLNVDSVGLSHMGRRYSYELSAKNGSCSVRLQSSSESQPSWKQHVPDKTFLAVPSDIVGSHVPLHLELRIWNESGRYVMSN